MQVRELKEGILLSSSLWTTSRSSCAMSFQQRKNTSDWGALLRTIVRAHEIGLWSPMK